MRRRWIRIGLAAAILVWTTSLGSAAAARPELELTLLARGKRVIPLQFREQEKYRNSDVKPPDLLVCNRSHRPVELLRLEAAGYTDAGEAVRYLLDRPALQRLAAANARIDKLRRGGQSAVLATQMGAIDLPADDLCAAAILPPGGRQILLLSREFFMRHIAPQPLTALAVTLHYRSGRRNGTVQLRVPLIPYRCRGTYRLPLAGRVCIVQGAAAHAAHRLAHSQEFAIDMVDNRPTAGEPWVTAAGAPTSCRDYFVFDRPVLAAADGTVVAAAGGFPDETMADPSSYSAEKMAALREELVPRIGYLNFLAGNHVIIDHHNGEYSVYAHLREHSLRVKAGDTVSQGQEIGRVGNTGNSEEPHLHFQLMDGPDFLGANGLPVMFSDLPPAMLGLAMDEINSVAGSEYIFSNGGER